jgi:hypothetical protein
MKKVQHSVEIRGAAVGVIHHAVKCNCAQVTDEGWTSGNVLIVRGDILRNVTENYVPVPRISMCAAREALAHHTITKLPAGSDEGRQQPVLPTQRNDPVRIRSISAEKDLPSRLVYGLNDLLDSGGRILGLAGAPVQRNVIVDHSELWRVRFARKLSASSPLAVATEYEAGLFHLRKELVAERSFFLRVQRYLRLYWCCSRRQFYAMLYEVRSLYFQHIRLKYFSPGVQQAPRPCGPVGRQAVEQVNVTRLKPAVDDVVGFVRHWPRLWLSFGRKAQGFAEMHRL